MADQNFTETKNPKRNTRPVGRSGTLITGDVIQEDYLSELIGIDGQRAFHKMALGDSQIRKLIHSVNNPIKSATWSIEPFNDDERNVEIASLIEQILFCDIPGGWTGKLDEILTFPWHGHAVFEPIHRNVESQRFGPYTSLSNISFRDQRTLDYWKFSREGVLEAIHQIQYGEVNVNVDIPAENLLIFYNEKKGNDSGYPFLRMLYGNYKRKLLYKQLQAIGIEKGAIGVPVLKLPQGVDYQSDEYNQAVDVLSNYTQAESAHIILPFGYEIELNQGNVFDPSKVQAAIKAENEEIVGSLVGMWLEMGIGGNSAVGASTGISADFFKDGIEYIANKIVETINNQLIPQLVALNYGTDIEEMPRLSHSGIADEAGEELMKVVTGYVQQGVITTDEQLEDHIRKVHNLPKKMEGELVENGETQEQEAQESEQEPEPAQDEQEETQTEEEVDLNMGKPKTPRGLITQQSGIVSDGIRGVIRSSGARYVNAVMNKYNQLPDSRKQNATNDIVMGGRRNMRLNLRETLSAAVFESIQMARREVPAARNVELSERVDYMEKIQEKYGDVSDIKLNEFSDLPGYMQVLVAKQSQLISDDTINDLESTVAFSFSSIETRTNDPAVIRQALEDSVEDFATANNINTKGTNAASFAINQGRNSFFYEPEVLDEIESFTFINASPVSTICRELVGTTFATNDRESLRYAPPLHHNCKSYLRANLKTSRGASSLEVSTLSPSAEARRTITL